MTATRRPSAWLVCVVAGAALLVLGIVLLAAFGTDRASLRAAAVPVVNLGPATSSPGSTPPPATDTSAAPTPTPHRPPPPDTRLRLPRLGVDAPVVAVRAVADEMQVPDDPRTVGWWADGAAPGDANGDTVIVGHINYAGVSGALAALPQLRLGDLVLVDEPGLNGDSQTQRYTVTAVRTYPKNTGLPADLFRRDGPAQLVLITCGGPFDTASGNYEDNIVAFATPA